MKRMMIITSCLEKIFLKLFKRVISVVSISPYMHLTPWELHYVVKGLNRVSYISRNDPITCFDKIHKLHHNSGCDWPFPVFCSTNNLSIGSSLSTYALAKLLVCNG